MLVLEQRIPLAIGDNINLHNLNNNKPLPSLNEDTETCLSDYILSPIKEISMDGKRCKCEDGTVYAVNRRYKHKDVLYDVIGNVNIYNKKDAKTFIDDLMEQQQEVIINDINWQLGQIIKNSPQSIIYNTINIMDLDESESYEKILKDDRIIELITMANERVKLAESMQKKISTYNKTKEKEDKNGLMM